MQVHRIEASEQCFACVEQFEMVPFDAVSLHLAQGLQEPGLLLHALQTEFLRPAVQPGFRIHILSLPIVTDPKLIIADEPVSMVDASLRISIVNLFKDLRDELGVSILYITHDLATAYYVSDRIAIMFRGNIVEMGTVEEVLMNPRHPYSKLLRDSIPQADPKKRWTTTVTLSVLEHEEYQRQGCKFAGRCPNVMDICKGVVPADIRIDDVLVKCHKYTDE